MPAKTSAPRPRRICGGWFLVFCALLLPRTLAAQSAENVALVINQASPDSVRVGEHYASVRRIPASNIVRLQLPATETIDRATYVRTIEQPLAAWLARENLQDRILYLVLTRGVPLRIDGPAGPTSSLASVDSELTLLYRKMTGQFVAIADAVPNPYFLGTRPIAEARPFTHRDHDIYLVTRLDAFTVEEAIALVDRAAATAPTPTSRVVLDQRDALTNRVGEEWIDEAAERLTVLGLGDRVTLERTPKPVRDIDQVVGYFSWGSTDPQNRVRRVGMSFVPGAIAATLVGSDARTFREPAADWLPPANPANKAAWYAGSPESLTGDLIREGVTGVAGSVAESLFAGSVRPQILLPAYASGLNLAEAFYLAIPRLSWRTVVIGDPLVAAFPRKTILTRRDIEADDDEVTRLPGHFSERRVRVTAAQTPGTAPRAVILNVRGEVLLRENDRRGARAAFEEAVQIAPNYPAPLLALALLDSELEQHESAITRYRRVVQLEPKNVPALNNLAYALAVHAKTPREALPLARRAAALAPNDPNILDTLAWVYHLLNENAAASKVMAQALRSSPPVPRIRLNAAIIYAAAGAVAVAETQLKAALALDPKLEDSDEVRALRAQLEKGSPK